MDHILFSDGNKKKISWIIQTGISEVGQCRNQAEIYIDKVSVEQSKYIALHVGIFWGIGTIIIKNDDVINVMLDSKSMYEHLSGKLESEDSFIRNRTNFIKKLAEQRGLVIRYILIEQNQNWAAKLLK